MEKIRVLVVDDSLIVRRVVMEEIDAQPDLEVAGTAINGRAALEQVRQLCPDLIILDIEMPEMDGLTALTHLRQSHPHIPVIMFSSLTELGAAATLEALSRGASDFFAKTSGAGGLTASRQIIREELFPAIRALCRKDIGAQPPHGTTSPGETRAKSAATAPSAPRVRPAHSQRVDLVAIGASTGGPNALAELFAGLPAGLPVPMVIVQHMPAMFTRMLADRLSRDSPVQTREALSGADLEPGKAWVAPGDFHLEIVRERGRAVTRLHQEPPENACRPAVDPLFRSAAQTFGAHCLAVVLTGMGRDGLRGCESIRDAGGQILAQDEATSVVWGMPGYVVKAGLADQVLPLPQIAAEIVRRVRLGRD